jgi:hypothetical protein
MTAMPLTRRSIGPAQKAAQAGYLQRSVAVRRCRVYPRQRSLPCRR